MKKFISFVVLLLALIPVSDVMAKPLDFLHAVLTRTIRGTNSIGWSAGDRVLASADFNATQFSNAGGASATTMMGTAPNGSEYKLWYNDFFGQPNFSKSVNYSPDITKPWKLTVSNGGDVVSKDTNTLAGIAAVPFVRNVKLEGAGLEPKISWDISGDVSGKRVDVFLHKADGTRFWRPGNHSMPASTKSVTIPAGVLEDGKKYTVRVKVFEPHPTTGYPLSQAETFIDFTPLRNGDPSTVYMPVVGKDRVPGDGFGAPFYFDVNVTASTPIFINPFIAVGYEYKIGTDDPLFESVTLPFLGDNIYQLWLNDGSIWSHDTDIFAGSKYLFGGSGIDSFRVLGIEESLGLNPGDVAAFITELTFAGDGTFTGSMTPIIQEVDSVPEPTTMLLFCTGLMGLAGVSFKRRRK